MPDRPADCSEREGSIQQKPREHSNSTADSALRLIALFQIEFSGANTCKMLDDSPGSAGADEGLKLVEAGFRDAFQTAEVAKQACFQLIAYSRDRCQLAFEIAHRSALAVI